MLINDVLAALEEAEIPCSHTRFATPPETGPYVAWGESVVAGGADALPNLRAHSAVLRVYENQGETGSVLAQVDDLLDAMAGQMTAGWSRLPREWLVEESVYVTEYSFAYIEKKALA